MDKKKKPSASKKRSKKAAPKPTATPDDETPLEAPKRFPIVGIGASAGGLKALETLFSNMPPDSGMAFVIVTHLDPNHKSLLGELLSRFTRMPVQNAEEGMLVLPNHIYVIPANRELALAEGQLHLNEPAAPRGFRHPVDSFLRSLAMDQGEDAIAVILSGTGSDGTLGVKAVKEAGGVVVIQSPESADYPGMPQSAADTGTADLMLPVKNLPTELLAFISRTESLARRLEEGLARANIPSQISRIFRIVDEVTGHDFNSYKLNTLVRRVERRMAVTGFEDMSGYTKYLLAHEEESRALFKDVLIGVTRFFRDDSTFEVLANEVLPRLIKDRARGETIRIWDAGCATGEEAYSLAILCREQLGRQSGGARIQIFATDIDEDAIANARLGVYPESIEADVSRDRLDRFFQKDGVTYRVLPSLREMIVFAQHNLIRDPPFSRLDMICCRNLLIYLEPDLQRRIVPLFYQSLNPGGTLVLGTSETVGSHGNLFEIRDKKNKIYQGRESVGPVAVDFPLNSNVQRKGPIGAGQRPFPQKSIDVGELAGKTLLAKFAPPAVVINENREIIHYTTSTYQFLTPPVGEPTNDLLLMVREELRPALRAAVHKAMTEDVPVVYKNQRLERNDKDTVTIRVEPFMEPAAIRGLCMVTFEKSPSSGDDQGEAGVEQMAGAASSEDMVRQLEEQLRINQAQLQSTVEQLETSNEELKSSNEELMSMNEELQSSNEELETSKEELQALNEELITVNSELQSKVEELAETNSDIHNLTVSSQSATMFLDRNLLIKRFTPAMSRVLNLIDADLGRPVSHISSRGIEYPEFAADAAKVLDSLESIERRVTTTENDYYLVRILPYRTIEDVIEGVAVTFSDITRIMRAEKELRGEQALIKTMMETTDAMIVYLDPEFNFLAVNPPYAETCRKSPEELIGKNHFALYPHEENEAIFRQVRDTGKGVTYRDKAFTFPDQPERGVTFWDWSLQPVLDTSNKVTGLVFTLRETTDRVQLVANLEESEYRHRIMGEIIPYGVWLTDAQGYARYISQSWCEMVGRTLEEVQEFGWVDALVPEQRQEVLELWKRSVESGEPFEHEHRFRAADGTIRTVLARGLPIRDAEGKITAWAGINLDISLRKEAELENMKLLEQLQESSKLKALGTLAGGIAHEFNNILTIVMGYSSDALIDLQRTPPVQDIKVLEKQLTMIMGASYRARDLVGQIMNFGRVSPPCTVVIDLAESIPEIMDDLKCNQPGKPRVQVRDLGDERFVLADRSQLTQILSNLLKNAMAAVDQERGEVFLDAGPVRLSKQDRHRLGELADVPYLAIRITDNGPGMSPEVVGRVFEPFFTTKDPGQGTGLGLSVVHSFVEANGGATTVRSEPGQGTTFEVILPQSLEAPVEKTSQTSIRMKGTRLEKVLFVDDEQALVDLVQGKLTSHGFTVTAMTSPIEAARVFQKDPGAFDAVVTDQKMPGMLGLELAEHIHRLAPEVPIVLFSGYGKELSSRDLSDFGITRLCQKPLDLADLAQILEDLFDERALRKKGGKH